VAQTASAHRRFSDGALALAVVALVVFLLAQVRGAHPMVPLDLFRSRPVAVSLSVGFTFTIGFYGLVFLLSLYLQELRGLSPLATGLTFLPMTGLTIFVTPLAPRAAARWGPRVPIAAGQFLMAVGLLSVCIAAADAPAAVLAVLMILVGLGASLTIAPMTALLVGSVPAERAGIASGVLNTCRQVGGALAVAVFGALVAPRDLPSGPSDQPGCCRGAAAGECGGQPDATDRHASKDDGPMTASRLPLRTRSHETFERRDLVHDGATMGHQ
jgi:predicted MFS family arabinose efflux permease